MCHGDNGKGGVPNPNSKNKEVPALTFAAQGLFADDILQKILHGSLPEKADPKGEEPLYVMPAWQGIITNVEAKSLVAYVESLMPKGADKSW
jgi:mono/diheme cytochrome c family protein